MKLKHLSLALISGALALSSCTPAYAQEGGYTIHVDFKTREAVQCAMAKIGTIENVNLLGFKPGNIDVSALIALQSQTSLGIAFTKAYTVGSNASLHAGLAIRTLQEPGEAQVRFRTGGVVGATWRF